MFKFVGFPVPSLVTVTEATYNVSFVHSGPLLCGSSVSSVITASFERHVYTFTTIAAGGNITISTCGSPLDTFLFVFDI